MDLRGPKYSGPTPKFEAFPVEARCLPSLHCSASAELRMDFPISSLLDDDASESISPTSRCKNHFSEQTLSHKTRCPWVSKTRRWPAALGCLGCVGRQPRVVRASHCRRGTRPASPHCSNGCLNSFCQNPVEMAGEKVPCFCSFHG